MKKINEVPWFHTVVVLSEVTSSLGITSEATKYRGVMISSATFHQDDLIVLDKLGLARVI